MTHQSHYQNNNIWRRTKRKASKDLDAIFDDDLSNLADLSQCSVPLSAKRQAISDVSCLTIGDGDFIPIESDQVVHTQVGAGTSVNTANPLAEEEQLCVNAATPLAEEEQLCDFEQFQFESVEEEDYDSESELADNIDSDFNDIGIPFTPAELADLRSSFDEPEHSSQDSHLQADLTVWSLQYKIGRNALTDLLHILHKYNHPGLPLCSKTLMKTPRSTVKMFKSLAGGLFWYYGILVNLIPRLTESFLGNLNGNLIKIDVFVDGVSPYKSVKKVLWPICGSLAGSKDIFIIAMWCGGTKEPGSLSLFLEDFIVEAKQLMLGFTHLGFKLKLCLRNVIADAPARTWLKNVNKHGSYYACERCTAVGQWIANRMTYHPREETLPRTDLSVRDQLDKRYHKGSTPLSEIDNFSLISQMPLEPMHLLSLGVMKRILLQLLGTKRNTCHYKFSDTLKSTVDRLSLYIAQFFPFDFARKPRKWTDYALYKATEFRRILLYDGFIMLKATGVSRKVYSNYRLLACAIRILSDPLLVLDFVDDADTLLKKFVVDSASVYGQKFIVYNVHHLKHLAEECKRHGDLETFSAFKYENHLGVLKRLLHAPGRTLSQIVCRLLEQIANAKQHEEVQQEVIVSTPCDLPSSLNHLGKGFSSISIPSKNIVLSKISFFLTVDKEIVKMSNIIKTEESYILVGKVFQRKTNYFTSPLPSSVLDIYEVDNLGPRQCFTVNQVLKKCVVVPIPSENEFPSTYSEGPCLAMSMPHGGD